jgi:hypothetical protein
VRYIEERMMNEHCAQVFRIFWTAKGLIKGGGGQNRGYKIQIIYS